MADDMTTPSTAIVPTTTIPNIDTQLVVTPIVERTPPKPAQSNLVYWTIGAGALILLFLSLRKDD